MTEEDQPRRKKPGRPPELEMPDLIPDTPENIARACMKRPPKREWDYLRTGVQRREKQD